MSNFYTHYDWYIPARMGHGIKLWIEKGIYPGGFLTAVIENNLKEAVGRADDENVRNLPAYVAYFYNEAPAGCWGSEEIAGLWATMMAAKRELADEDEKLSQG